MNSDITGNLSKGVFERRTLNGVDFFAFLGIDFCLNFRITRLFKSKDT